MRLATAASALLFSLLLAACSSSSNGGGTASTPCNQDPWECSSGQTCWPQSESAFACMNAGPGSLGSACQDTVGSPSCGAGMFCLQGVNTTGGACVAYCSTTDPKHACTGNAQCEEAFLGSAGGPAVTVCVSTISTNGDAGTAPDGNAAADGGSDAPAGG
jgi:hypothetical protein